MTYSKTTWETGDVITAQKLNNIESGIDDRNKLIILTFEWDSETQTDNWSSRNPTPQELYNQISNGASAILISGEYIFNVDVSDYTTMHIIKCTQMNLDWSYHSGSHEFGMKFYTAVITENDSDITAVWTRHEYVWTASLGQNDDEYGS